MKKFIKTLICLFLVAIVSVSVIGCGKGSGDGSSLGGIVNSKKPFAINERGDYTGGRHIRERGTTDYDFIVNSRTDYVAVLPSGASADVNSAFSEFNGFVKEASGLTLAKVSDDALPAEQKFISFGRTAQLQAAIEAGDVVVPSDLRGNGFVIETVGQNIFVVGGQDIGVIFGTYQLAYLMFNYTQYTVEIYYIDKDVKNLKLPDLHYFEGQG